MVEWTKELLDKLEVVVINMAVKSVITKPF